jgi:hypothetical protein
MKLLKVLILLLICGSSFGQFYSNINTPLYWHYPSGFDSLFLPNHDTLPVLDKSKRWITLKGAVLYYYDGAKWTAISGTGSGGSYTLPQATPTVLGGIKYNTDFYIDANGRLGIDTSKKNLWNQIANLPLYAKIDSTRKWLNDTANAHDYAFGNGFIVNGRSITVDFPQASNDSYLSSIWVNLTNRPDIWDGKADQQALNDTAAALRALHPPKTYYVQRDFVVVGDTVSLKNPNGGGGSGGSVLPYNGDPAYYLGGDTLLHSLPSQPPPGDSIDYSFTAMSTVYNENGPGEFTVAPSGVTVNADNTTFPFRQLKALDIGGWTSSSYISFTKSTTFSTTAYTFLRAFIRLKSVVDIPSSLSFRFYRNGSPISSLISCVNYGLTKNKVGSYMNISIPMTAFGFTSNSFDELRFELGGSNSSGLFMDLVQLQNASVDENKFVTDVHRIPGTLTVQQVLGGQNTFAFNDSVGVATDTTSLSTRINQKVNTTDTAAMLIHYLTSATAAASYFPLSGGTLTGTAGNGYVGFIPQSSTPSTPTSGFKLFATNPGAFAWVTSAGYARELRVRAQTQNNIYYLQDKSYTLADSVDVALKENALTFSAPLKRTGNTISADTSTAVTGLVTKGFLASQNYGSGGSGGVATALILSSATTLALDYSNDYIFSGTTTTWTLPAIDATKTGRNYMVTIKNRGSGNITLNSNSGSTIYDASAVATITVYPGESYILMPGGTYFNVE